MITGPINSVYLSGWEYNRLLQSDPTQPRNSALPAEILWNGAAYLWLFEQVYCTKESLANEYAAHEILGWTTGRIFRELENNNIVVPLDWATGITEPTKQLLRNVHSDLRKRYNNGRVVRELIQQQDYLALEAIKMELLKPIADNRGFIVGVTPNSLSLASWRQRKTSTVENLGMKSQVQKFLSDLSRPVMDASPRWQSKAPSSGLILCHRPGTDVPPADIQRQTEVQRTVEAPMITDLLSGEEEYSGSAGYVPYLHALRDYRKVYEPINVQLYSNWHENQSRLYLLRQAAKKYLWPQLHGEWLPQLIADPGFAEQLPGLIRHALRRAAFSDLLAMPSTFVFGVAVPAAGLLAKVLAEIADLPGHPADLITLTATSATAAALAAAKAKVDRRVKAHESLALFYQRAKKIVA